MLKELNRIKAVHEAKAGSSEPPEDKTPKLSSPGHPLAFLIDPLWAWSWRTPDGSRYVLESNESLDSEGAVSAIVTSALLRAPNLERKLANSYAGTAEDMKERLNDLATYIGFNASKLLPVWPDEQKAELLKGCDEGQQFAAFACSVASELVSECMGVLCDVEACCPSFYGLDEDASEGELRSHVKESAVQLCLFHQAVVRRWFPDVVKAWEVQNESA